MIDPDGLAGRGNGGDGSATGRGTQNQYKHCREFNPPDPRFIECKDKKSGKKIRVPRPSSWPFPEPKKKEMCEDPRYDENPYNDPPLFIFPVNPTVPELPQIEIPPIRFPILGGI